MILIVSNLSQRTSSYKVYACNVPLLKEHKKEDVGIPGKDEIAKQTSARNSEKRCALTHQNAHGFVSPQSHPSALLFWQTLRVMLTQANRHLFCIFLHLTSGNKIATVYGKMVFSHRWMTSPIVQQKSFMI